MQTRKGKSKSEGSTKGKGQERQDQRRLCALCRGNDQDGSHTVLLLLLVPDLVQPLTHRQLISFTLVGQWADKHYKTWGWVRRTRRRQAMKCITVTRNTSKLSEGGQVICFTTIWLTSATLTASAASLMSWQTFGSAHLWKGGKVVAVAASSAPACPFRSVYRANWEFINRYGQLWLLFSDALRNASRRGKDEKGSKTARENVFIESLHATFFYLLHSAVGKRGCEDEQRAVY